MSPRKKTEVSPMEFILLGIISETPMHGYDVFKKMSQPGGMSEIWHFNQSNLYALLDGLEESGYLISHLIQIGNSPTRKEYHITSAGTALFEKWVREPVLHGRDMRQVFLAKLFFAIKESPETTRTLVTKQKSITNIWLMDIESTINELTAEDEYDRLVLDSRRRQITGWLEWLDECTQSEISNRRF
jgi:PadR family transcriptional regulator, regulatory protein AphA